MFDEDQYTIEIAITDEDDVFFVNDIGYEQKFQELVGYDIQGIDTTWFELGYLACFEGNKYSIFYYDGRVRK